MPSTPSSDRGAGDAVAVQRRDDVDVRRARRAARATAAVDGQLHLLVRLVGGAVAAAGEARALQGEQAAAGDLAQLLDDRLDPLAIVDRDRDQRQVLREREQAVGLQPLAGAEALGPAQQDAGREAAALEEVEDRGREEAARRGGRARRSRS